MNKRHEEPEEKEGKWLTTFNDMLTLLLTFMVLVLSLSTLDTAKVKEASHSFSSARSFLWGGDLFDISVFIPFVKPLKGVTLTDKRQKGELYDYINDIEGIHAVMVEEGISAILKDTLLFETGSAEIKAEKRPVIEALSSVLKETDCRIRVEGHTDDVPINSTLFPSNWELSMARAVNVTEYLISEGDISPERLSVASYADSKPLFPNVSDHNRERNRRVEVLLILHGNGGGSNNG